MREGYSRRYDIYVKGGGISTANTGTFAAAVVSEERRRFSPFVRRVASKGINNRELLGLGYVLGLMGERSESEVFCHLNNESLVLRLNSDYGEYYEEANELIVSLREKKKNFREVRYVFIPKGDEWVSYVKALAVSKFARLEDIPLIFGGMSS